MPESSPEQTQAQVTLPLKLVQQLFVCAIWGPTCCGCNPPDDGLRAALEAQGIDLPTDGLEKWDLEAWLEAREGDDGVQP
jgi:hypothetical protein